MPDRCDDLLVSEVYKRLICDYNTGFIAPEMVKRRPVVVISPRLRNRPNLCTIVPLSGTVPDREQEYHCCIEMEPPLPKPWDSKWFWVKADMIATVSFSRLELVRGPKDFEGKRKYIQRNVGRENLLRIRRCVLCALGLSALTGELDGPI